MAYNRDNIRYNYVIFTCILLLLASCIKNDIPYPYIQANFLSISAETQDQGSIIDSISRKVTFTFPETTDIYNVKISDYTITPGAELVGDPFAGGIDLSTPKTVILRLYQDYEWQMIANQNISRYMTLSGQVGSSVIDVPAHRVVAYVSDNIDITAVKVETIKLGADGSEMSPNLNGKVVDFTHEVQVTVTTTGAARSGNYTLRLQKVQ